MSPSLCSAVSLQNPRRTWKLAGTSYTGVSWLGNKHDCDPLSKAANIDASLRNRINTCWGRAWDSSDLTMNYVHRGCTPERIRTPSRTGEDQAPPRGWPTQHRTVSFPFWQACTVQYCLRHCASVLSTGPQVLWPTVTVSQQLFHGPRRPLALVRVQYCTVRGSDSQGSPSQCVCPCACAGASSCAMSPRSSAKPIIISALSARIFSCKHPEAERAGKAAHSETLQAPG